MDEKLAEDIRATGKIMSMITGDLAELYPKWLQMVGVQSCSEPPTADELEDRAETRACAIMIAIFCNFLAAMPNSPSEDEVIELFRIVYRQGRALRQDMKSAN